MGLFSSFGKKKEEQQKELGNIEARRKALQGTNGKLAYISRPEIKCGKEYIAPLYNPDGETKTQYYERFEHYDGDLVEIGYVLGGGYMEPYIDCFLKADGSNRNIFYFLKHTHATNEKTGWGCGIVITRVYEFTKDDIVSYKQEKRDLDKDASGNLVYLTTYSLLFNDGRNVLIKTTVAGEKRFLQYFFK